MLIHLFQIIPKNLCVSQSVNWLTSLLKLDKWRDSSSSGWDIFLKFFEDIPGTLVHIFQILLNSVSCLTSLLKLDKFRDISRSGWDIFLIFFGGIAGMFVHLFQIVTNFLYVCQYVSWLTFLLKLNKYWDISSSGWDNCLKFVGDFPWQIWHFSDNFLLTFCFSGGQLLRPSGLVFLQERKMHYMGYYINIGISPVLDKISFWNFGSNSWNVFILFPNNSDFFCMSVSLVVGMLP